MARVKNTVTVESRFPHAARAGREFMEHAIKKAIDEGEYEAERRLERANDSHGWNLPTEIEQEVGRDKGRIYYPQFFGRWFEYGALHIEAFPFMRPAHRRMRKRFKDEMGNNFEGWLRRRATVRRRR